MPTISVGDLTTLRAGGHRIKPYLSVLVPRDLWSARVNDGAIGRGAETVAFDGGSGLDFGEIVADQEVWVGSTAGADDIGRARVTGTVSVNGGVSGAISVAPNSLLWTDNAYLTFKHDYPLKPRYPYIDENGVFTKDGQQIVYGNQNSQPPPVCIAGPHRAVWMEDSLAGVSFQDEGANDILAVPEGSDITLTGNGAIFYGSNTGVNISPSQLVSNGWDGNEGTIIMGVRNDAVWSSSQDYLFRLANTNSENIGVTLDENGLTVIRQTLSPTVTKTISHTSIAGRNTFFVFGTTWSLSGNAFKAFVDGAQVGTTQTSIGTWDSVALNTAATVFLARETASVISNSFNGYARDIVVSLGVVATDVQVASISTLITQNNLSVAALNTVFGIGNWAWYTLDDDYNQTAELNVDLSDSYAVAQGATINSYSISVYPSVPAASVDGGGIGSVTINTAGQYWVTFGVTDSNGKQTTTHRSYWVYDRNGVQPFTDFALNQIVGDWDRGGWTGGLQLTDNADLGTIPDKALAVLWADWEYEDGEVTTPITFLPDSNPALLVGYIRNDKLAQNEETGTGTDDIEITTIDGLLRNKYNYSVSLEAVNSTPDTWYEYEEWLTVGRALHHLYCWHSTLLSVCDFYGLLDNTDLRPYAEMEDNNLYAMGDTLSRHRGTRQHITCDRGGRLWLVDEPQLLNDAGRAGLTEVAELTDDDRSGVISIVREPENRVCFVHVSGFYWDGTYDEEDAPQPNAICAIAPGEKPADDGPSVISLEKQTLSGQTDANEIAGRVFAVENNHYPEVRVNFHGNYLGVLEPAINHPWRINLQTGDTIKELVWSNKLLFLKNVTATFNVAEGTVDVKATFEPDADGEVGIPTDCPTFPDLGGDDYPIPEEEGGEGGDIMSAASMHLFNPNTNGWTQKTGEAVSDAYSDPWWRTTQASEDVGDAIIWRGGVGYIKRSTDGGDTWNTVTPGDNPPNDAGDDPAPGVGEVTFTRGEGSWVTAGTHVWMATWQNGGDEWRTWLALTDDDGDTWTWQYVGTGGDNTCVTDAAAAGLFTTPAVEFDDAFGVIIIRDVAGTRYTMLRFYSNDDCSFMWEYELASHTAGGSINSISYLFKRLNNDLFAAVKRTVMSGIHGEITTIEVYSIDWVGEGLTLEDSYIYHGVGNPNDRRYTQQIVKVDNGLGELSGEYMMMIVLVRKHLVIGGGESIIYVTFGYDGTIMEIDSDTAITDDNNEIFLREITLYEVHAPAQRIFHSYYIRGVAFGDGGEISGIEIEVSDSGIINYTVHHVLLSLGAEEAQFIASASIGGNRSMVGWVDATDSYKKYATYMSMSSSEFGVGIPSVVANYGMLTKQGMGTIGTDAAWFVTSDTDPGAGNLVIYRLSVDGSGISVGGETVVRDDSIGSYPFGVTDNLIITYHTSTVLFRAVKMSFSATVRGLGMSLGKATGEGMYVTGWNQGSGELEVQAFSVPALELVATYTFGVATEGEIDAKTYIMYPYCPFGSDYLVYLYGRMPDGNNHILYSDDGAASVSVVEGSWGTDHCGALIEDFENVYAIRNVSGGAKLYVGSNDGVNLKSTLPIAAQVNPRAIEWDWYNGLLYVGAGSSGAVLVVRTSPPYMEWENITFDHPTGNGLNSLFKV